MLQQCLWTLFGLAMIQKSWQISRTASVKSSFSPCFSTDSNKTDLLNTHHYSFLSLLYLLFFVMSSKVPFDSLLILSWKSPDGSWEFKAQRSRFLFLFRSAVQTWGKWGHDKQTEKTSRGMIYHATGKLKSYIWFERRVYGRYAGKRTLWKFVSIFDISLIDKKQAVFRIRFPQRTACLIRD